MICVPSVAYGCVRLCVCVTASKSFFPTVSEFGVHLLTVSQLAVGLSLEFVMQVRVCVCVDECARQVFACNERPVPSGKCAALILMSSICFIL